MIVPNASSKGLRDFIEERWSGATRTIRVNSRRYLDRLKRYISKPEKIQNVPSGKCWGEFNSEMIESFIHHEIVEEIEHFTAMKIRRWFARLSHRHLGEAFHSLWVYIPNTDIERLRAFLQLDYVLE